MPANHPEERHARPEETLLTPESDTDGLLEAALLAVDCGLVIYGPTGDIRRMNQTAERIFHYDRSVWTAPFRRRLEGFRLLDADERPLPLEEFPVARALAGATVREKIVIVQREGRPDLLLSVSAAPIVSAGGARTGAVASFSDITERLELERRLRQEKEAAEAQSRQKGEFLATTSHEIRTPLNGVIGMAELALLTDLPPEAREYVQLVRLSAKSLLDIVNDILDLSKIESGRMELEPVEFDLRRLMETLLRTLGVGAAEKGLRLHHRIDPAVPAWLKGDEGRLRQVLVNLVGNAIKFTDEGSIEVALEVDAEEQGRLRLRFTVRDTGTGIPPDRLDSVFERFAQAPGSARQGGTGLGLAICKRLVDLMGGTIGVRSEPGRGSEFTFTALFEPLLRRTPAAEESRSVPVRDDVGSLRLLLAEDNAVNRLLASTLLQKRGHAVTAVQSGREALDRLRHEEFDAVLMDVRMPEMSGEEATRLIRAGVPSPARRGVAIVALTAHALKGDRERFLAAGMDDYVSKPIDPDELDAALRRAVAFRRGAPRPGPTA